MVFFASYVMPIEAEQFNSYTAPEKSYFILF